MKKILLGLLIVMNTAVSHAQTTGDKVIIHIGGHVFSVDGDVNLESLGNSQTITKGDSTITRLPNITIIINPKRHTKEIYINGGSEDFSFGPGGNYYMDLNERVDSMLSNPQVWSMNMPNFSFKWGNGNFPNNTDSMMNPNRIWIDSMMHKNWNGTMPQQYHYYYNNEQEDNDSGTTKQRLQDKIEKLQEKLNNLQNKLNNMDEQLNEEENDASLSAPQDTTRIRIGNFRIVINQNGVKFNHSDSSEHQGNYNDYAPARAQKNITTHWLLLDLGYNTYLNNFSTSLPSGYSPLELLQGKSINVNLHIFQQSVNLVKQHLFFEYGVSFEFNNYRFRQNTSLIPKIDSVKFAESPAQLSKDKLSDTYLTIPVVFQYESNKNFAKSFRVGLGMNVGYLIASHTKQVSAQYGKVKVWDNFDLNTFRYGPTLRIGFSWFNLYANYSLDGLFRTASAPILNPLSFGISIIAD